MENAGLDCLELEIPVRDIAKTFFRGAKFLKILIELY